MSEKPSASIPWEGIRLLSSLWAGSGTLYEWIRPDEFTTDADWSIEIIKARMTLVVLLMIEERYANTLPKHGSDWLDQIGNQVQLSRAIVDTPSPHTDWSTTISMFGRYPCASYIEKQRTSSRDTSYTRILKWTAQSFERAWQLVVRSLRNVSLDDKVKRQFTSVLELPEVAMATVDLEALSLYDIEACRRSGGIWLVLAKIAQLFAALWRGSATTQIYSLYPILPKFEHQLFELGTLGTVANGIREVADGCSNWISECPLGAVTTGTPSLRMNALGGQWCAYYQTVPNQYSGISSPYRVLNQNLTGGSLRPDIWIEQSVDGQKSEVVIECKFSMDPPYVASGVSQSLAYESEYPCPNDTRRIHAVIGPEEVLGDTATWWGDRFVLTSPSRIKEICQRSFLGTLDTPLDH